MLAKFEKIQPIKVDMTKGNLTDIRGALGISDAQPQLIFFDRQGRLRRGADLLWAGKGADDEHKAAGEAVHKRLDLILGETAGDGSENAAQ